MTDGPRLIVADANVYVDAVVHDATKVLGDPPSLAHIPSLVVPYQVVREFHRRRLSAIGNPESAARSARDALDKNRRSTTDVLTGLSKQLGLDDATQTGLLADVTPRRHPKIKYT